jgi:tetratricopeptide (TPR) repeat protein
LAGYHSQLAVEPGNADLLDSIAEIHTLLGETVRGLEYFRRCLSLAPNRPRTLVKYAVALKAAGHRAEAFKAVEQAAALDPLDAQVQAYWGRQLVEAGRVNQAVNAFERSLHADGDQTDVQIELANLYLAQRQFAAAERHFRAALQQRPHDVNTLGRLGLIAALVRDWRQAESWFERALAINPQHHETLANFARALHQQGRYEDSIAAYRRALATPDVTIATRQQLAWLLAVAPIPEFRNPQEALRLIHDALRAVGQPTPQLLDTLAAAEAASGDFESAQHTADRALERARQAGLESLTALIQARAALYADGKVFVEPQREPSEK